MWYVYILRCRDNTFYTGVTNDPVRRLGMHNAGTGAKYTRSRLPVEMVYLESTESHPQALKREYTIKQLTRQEKISLIQSANAPLPR